MVGGSSGGGGFGLGRQMLHGVRPMVKVAAKAVCESKDEPASLGVAIMLHRAGRPRG